ncbi:MAG: ATP-binding cassette domain-containing protein [Acidimicrobiales bacterium]
MSFSLPKAGIVGVVGGNGAGKTTLFKMLIAAATGDGEQPDDGSIVIGDTVELAFVDQSRMCSTMNRPFITRSPKATTSSTSAAVRSMDVPTSHRSASAGATSKARRRVVGWRTQPGTPCPGA